MKIFLTGASSGLGEGLARRYAAPGVTLGLVARRADLLASLQKELEQRGAAVHVYAGDVADTAFCEEAAASFCSSSSAGSGCDLVIANAGVGLRGDAVRKGDAAGVAQLLRINVVGVTNTVVPFVPRMLAQKSGVLVAVSSFAGHRALPGRVPYCASKAAVICFMDGLRMELDGSGVHAMTICPGYVKTPLTAHNQGMRFVVELDDAVEQMHAAIAARADTFTFPWQMRVLKHVVTRAPERLLKKLAPPGRPVD